MGAIDTILQAPLTAFVKRTPIPASAADVLDVPTEHCQVHKHM